MRQRAATVVGGGIIGLFTAVRLAHDGWQVTLVEADRLGSGAALGNGGWVCPALSKPLAGPGMIAHAVSQTFSRDAALRLHLPPHRATAGWLSRFVRHCTPAHRERTWRAAAALSDFSAQQWDRLAEWGVAVPVNRAGILFLYPDRATARAGLEDAREVRGLGQQTPHELLSGEELRGIEAGISSSVGAGFLWPGQGYVDPRTLVTSLVIALQDAGVDVVEGAHAAGVHEDEDRVLVEAGGQVLRSDVAVVATGAAISSLLAPLGLRAPVIAGKGYSFDVPVEGAWNHAVSMPGPHVVATPLADGRLRLAGIMELDHDPQRFDVSLIEQVARGSAPYLTGVDWTDRRNEWVGARPLTPDTLPLVGPLRPGSRVVVAGGHGTMGVTQGPGTAELVRAHLAGSPLPAWQKELAPSRFTGARRLVRPSR